MYFFFLRGGSKYGKFILALKICREARLVGINCCFINHHSQVRYNCNPFLSFSGDAKAFIFLMCAIHVDS